MIDLASTLLFVAIKDNKFIMAHIGDGIIGYLKQDEVKNCYTSDEWGNLLIQQYLRRQWM